MQHIGGFEHSAGFKLTNESEAQRHRSNLDLKTFSTPFHFIFTSFHCSISVFLCFYFASKSI